MTRGTTPTLKFTLPIECSTLTKANIVFVQNNVVILEKVLSDCTYSGKELSLALSEADTLKFSWTYDLAIQLRVGVGTERMASQIFNTTVGRILKDGEL